MTLSDKFDQMEAKRAIVKPVYNAGASQRRVDVDSRRKVGRQTQFDARRQGVANTKPAMRAAQSKVVSPRQQPQQQQQQRVQQQGRGKGAQSGGGRNQKAGNMPVRSNAQKTAGRGGGAAGGRGPGRGGGRTGGRNANGGRGGGRGGRGGRGSDKGGRGNKSASTKPPKTTDLDEGLDEYWFKAGKGPDPKLLSLDRGLDSYWSKAGEKTNGDAAAGDDKMEDAGAEAPAAAASSAPVAGVDPEL